MNNLGDKVKKGDPLIVMIAMKMEVPSTQPWARPSLMIPMIRDTKAASSNIWRILSSKFSKINSHSVLILGSLLVLEPYLMKNRITKLKNLLLLPGVQVTLTALDTFLYNDWLTSILNLSNRQSHGFLDLPCSQSLVSERDPWHHRASSRRWRCSHSLGVHCLCRFACGRCCLGGTYHYRR